jgi:DNA polymerase III subunit delta
MIYLFSGTDTYESFIKAKEKLKELTLKYSASEISINADEVVEVNDFLQNLEGIGMFSSFSIIFAKRFFSNRKLVSYLENNFQKLNAYELVMWQDGKLDNRLKIIKELKAQKSFFEFQEGRESGVKSWLMVEARKKNIKLPATQMNYIVEHIGVNKWLLKNELDKIEIYAKSKNIDILKDSELFSLLGFDVKGDIWKFLDYVSSKDKTRSLEEFVKLTTYEDNGQYLIAMLQWQFRILCQIRYALNNNISTATLGINPFVLSKSIAKVKNFSWDELKNLVQKLFNLDCSIKSGDIDEKTGLVLYLQSL